MNTDVPTGRILILFTRYPRPGAAKTRLAPVLGEEGAAQLHRELTARALQQMRAFGGAEIEVWYTGADEAAMRDWLGDGATLRPQCDGELGARMAHAFASVFAAGACCAVIAGTDCPDLGPETFEAAFDALADRDLVLGPAIDGGYYLIGLRGDAWPRAAALFDGIAWGADQVFARTLEQADSAALSRELTAPLSDIDNPDDLAIWRRVNRHDPDGPELSVVIPTWNAGDAFESVLQRVTTEPRIEVLVADAGSTDGTRAIAEKMGARVIDAPRGRARQMNFATAWASGKNVLFLHSDTLVPAGFAEAIRQTLSGPRAVVGAFRFATDYPARSMRVVEAFTNLRSRWLQLPYGDQGLFMNLADFRRLGGFRDLPLMDDFDFVVRARRLGRIELAHATAVTSGRRWRVLGVWRTMLRNQVIVAMYRCGVPADRLARYYRRGMDR